MSGDFIRCYPIRLVDQELNDNRKFGIPPGPTVKEFLKIVEQRIKNNKRKRR